MDNATQIIRLLKNAGFHVHGIQGGDLIIEDPACIVRSFETFLDYAWIILVTITALLLFGWGIALIRGAKNGIGNTTYGMRNLVIIFGILSAIWPILNMIYGGDLLGRGCDKIPIPMNDIQKVLDARKAKMSPRSNDLYEEFDIYDSGVQYESVANGGDL